MSIILDEQGNEIKFRPMKFTLKQVAEEVGVADSTIRYWTKKFEGFLDIDNSSWKKEYTDRDIYIFKFIQKSTREEKLTMEQVTQLLEDQYGHISNVKFDDEIAVDSKEVAINTMIDARINTRLNDFKEEFKAELVEEVSNAVEEKLKTVLMQHFVSIEDMIKNTQIQNNEKLDEVKSEIAMTVIEDVQAKVSETVKESIEISSKTITDTLNKIEESTKERDLNQAAELKKFLDARKKANDELIEKEKNKGFFAKLFGK